MIRRYEVKDVPMMLDAIALAIRTNRYKRLNFDRASVENYLLIGLAKPTFFCDIVLGPNGEFGGGLCADLFEYPISSDSYAQCVAFYLMPKHRTLSNALALLRNFKSWGMKQQVLELRLDQSTGYRMKAFARLIRLAGFSLIGTKWAMEL